MKNVLAATIVGVLLSANTASADIGPGAWEVSQDVSPMTDLKTYHAALLSEAPLANQLGLAEKARFVVSCTDQGLAAYIVWPQVLDHDANSASLFSVPQTMVLVRIDGGKISTEFWDLSADQTAAGAFNTRQSVPLLTRLAGGHKLVVQMGGLTQQDAVFDLDGLDKVQAGAMTACSQSASAEDRFGADLTTPLVFVVSRDSKAAGVAGEFHEALVSGVHPGSIAAKAGLKWIDTIFEFDHQPVESTKQLQDQIKATPAGKVVEIKVVRSGKAVTLTAQF
jgi:PDZ domain-containing protein